MDATRTDDRPRSGIERPPVAGDATAAAAGDGGRGWYRGLALVAAVLILAQAVLAGQWMFGGGRIDVHGWLGNVTFLLAIGLVGLAFVGRRGGALGAVDLALSAVLLLLVVAQLGLGYSGRACAPAATLHGPNGVLLTGVTAAILALAFVPRGGSGRSPRR